MPGYVHGWAAIATALTTRTGVDISCEAARDYAKRRFRPRRLLVERGRRRVRVSVEELESFCAWFVAAQRWEAA